MEHPTLSEVIEKLFFERKDEWDQFFNGEWFLIRAESEFEETAFVYEGKIWYNQGKHGSGSYYSEGSISDVASLFLNSSTEFIRSNLKQKMDEVMDKRNEGYLIYDKSGKFDFQTRTKTIHHSDYVGHPDSELNMFELGEHLAWLIMEPSEWEYVPAVN